MFSADIDLEREKYNDIYGSGFRYENSGQLYGTVGNGIELIGAWPVILASDRILEVGCGYAKVSTEILRRKPGIASLTCVDISDVLIAKLQASNATGKIKFVCAPVHTLPFEDKQFDVVLAFDVLEHVPEPLVQKSLHELKRVSSTGLICSVAWHDDVKYGHTLHVTQHGKSWWTWMLSKFGEVKNVRKKPEGFYAYIQWGK